ncbi:hypothetical protein psyc5s11_54260 [Clostridium gelidum]|uniref:DUF4173 domain-containing protein n=1 Tax=Clostridium gelidum TaxID=704125 RepID=A0ABM7TBP7_9CLOT|nr:DUF4173 domain-containing protein [Clostridium gelidum]BCZ49359.1 hypothetical protein psyc5s11_54260 [Clostridium gelidum]
MKEQDGKSIIGVAIGTILFMELLTLGGWGIAVPIAVIIYYILILWQSKILMIKQNITTNILLIPIAMTALCFVFFDNTLLKSLNILFLYGLIVLNTSQQFGINRFEFLSFRWFLELVPIGILMPLENMGQPINVVKKEMKERSKDSNNVIFKVLIGLLIGLPIVFIATILLMNTDVAFESIITLIFEKFDFDLMWILQRIIFSIIIFFPLYGFFYGLRNKKDKTNEQKEKNKIQIFDFIIVITVTSFLCVVYMMYCLSQLTYFISAFKGILPADYTFAAYARKGFFECIPLGSINLLIIMVLTLFTKTENSKKKGNLIKGYTSYLVAFTLFLVISAFSKMWLYISAYGITIMRVYVSWFLIVGCITLLFIGIKTYYSKFKLTKNIFMVFTIMFLGLNYANIDYRIAEYDAQLYKTENVNTISAFDELSNSALEPLIKISDIDKDNTKLIIKKYENRVYGKTKWQDWNVTNYKAREILENR